MYSDGQRDVRIKLSKFSNTSQCRFSILQKKKINSSHKNATIRYLFVHDGIFAELSFLKYKIAILKNKIF